MSEAIFTRQDIDNFRLDTDKYNLTLTQIKPVVLQHVADKNENVNIKTYNINNTVEVIESLDSVEKLFKYMNNKLAKYEAIKNEQAIKSKIQEQVQG